MVLAGKMTVEHAPGNDNMADCLTKALDSEPLERYKRYMGMPGDYVAVKKPGRKPKLVEVDESDDE